MEGLFELGEGGGEGLPLIQGMSHVLKERGLHSFIQYCGCCVSEIPSLFSSVTETGGRFVISVLPRDTMAVRIGHRTDNLSFNGSFPKSAAQQHNTYPTLIYSIVKRTATAEEGPAL